MRSVLVLPKKLLFLVIGGNVQIRTKIIKMTTHSRQRIETPMTYFLKISIGLLAAASLSACSSSDPIVAKLSSAGGVGSGALDASTVKALGDAMDDIESKIDDGSLEAPAVMPTGSATMDGYVAMDMPDGPETVLGNLTVEADFDAGTVASSADGFSVWDFTGATPASIDAGITGGSLAGTGTIDRTSMTSTLDGLITTDSGNAAVDTDLNGSLYDNNGSLLVVGDVTGTLDGEVIEADSNFAVSE